MNEVDPRGVGDCARSSLVQVTYEADANKLDALDHKNTFPHTARTINETIEENERINEMKTDAFDNNMNLLPRLSSKNFKF